MLQQLPLTVRQIDMAKTMAVFGENVVCGDLFEHGAEHESGVVPAGFDGTWNFLELNASSLARSTVQVANDW